jgi:hypothetical protein
MIAAAALLLPAALQAQAARPSAAAQEPPAVAGVEVVAPSGAPKVLSTYPAQGAAVPPGSLALTVRFDHRMAPDAWSYGGGDGAPACLEKPRLLDDEKTFVLLCTVGFRGSFTVRLNADGKGFHDLAGTMAAPLRLSFTTTGGDPTLTTADAIKAAGLKDTDSPILDSKPATP